MKKRKMSAALVMLAVTAAMTMPVHAGWQKNGESYTYYNDETGNMQFGGLTPDGYLLDANGVWSKKSMTILDVAVNVPDRYTQFESTESFLNELSAINRKIQGYFPNRRVFHVYNRSVHYYELDDNKNETEIMSFTLMSDGYELKLKARVGSRSGGSNNIYNCDYAVYQYFLAKISHGPELLADAIVDSWQGSNSYGLSLFQTVNVGDAKVKMTAENGTGIYTIHSAV